MKETIKIDIIKYYPLPNATVSIFLKPKIRLKIYIRMYVGCTWVENTVHGVEICWHSVKDIVPGAAANKKGHADSILGQEKPHHNLFACKRCNYK